MCFFTFRSESRQTGSERRFVDLLQERRGKNESIFIEVLLHMKPNLHAHLSQDEAKKVILLVLCDNLLCDRVIERLTERSFVLP